jgi:hypothetical protein
MSRSESRLSQPSKAAAIRRLAIHVEKEFELLSTPSENETARGMSACRRTLVSIRRRAIASPKVPAVRPYSANRVPRGHALGEDPRAESLSDLGRQGLMLVPKGGCILSSLPTGWHIGTSEGH